MAINTDNYELFFLQYIEGTLSEAQRAEVEAFVAAHPEKAEELALYDPQLTLPANDEMHYTGPIASPTLTSAPIARRRLTLRLAAAACLLLAIVGGVALWNHNETLPTATQSERLVAMGNKDSDGALEGDGTRLSSTSLSPEHSETNKANTSSQTKVAKPETLQSSTTETPATPSEPLQELQTMLADNITETTLSGSVDEETPGNIIVTDRLICYDESSQKEQPKELPEPMLAQEERTSATQRWLQRGKRAGQEIQYTGALVGRIIHTVPPLVDSFYSQLADNIDKYNIFS